MLPITKTELFSTSVSEMNEESKPLNDISYTVQKQLPPDSSNLNSLVSMKVCRVCLAMDEKMYDISEHQLNIMFERVTGIEINTDNKLPQKLCWECVARLASANNYVEKVLKTQWVLFNIMNSRKFTIISCMESIKEAKTQLKPTLSKVSKVNDYYLDIIEKSPEIINEEITINNGFEEIKIKNEHIDIDFEIAVTEDEAVNNNGIYEVKLENNIEEFNIKVENLSDEMSQENHKRKKLNNIEDQGNVVQRMAYQSSENVQLEQNQFLTQKLYICEESHKFILKRMIYIIGFILIAVSCTFTPYFSKDEKKKEDERKQKQKNKVYSKRYRDKKRISIVKENESEIHGEMMEVILSDLHVDNYKQHQIVNIQQTQPNVNHPPIKQFSNNTDKTSINKDPEKFICDLCGRIFKRKSIFINHIFKHPKTYTCTYCSYRAPNKTRYNQHINARHTKIISFKCSLCNYTTNLKQSLSRHVNTKHSNKDIYKCPLCNFKTYNDKSLGKHVSARHTNKLYKCSLCNYTANIKYCLAQHISVVHNKSKSFKCSSCNFKSFYKTSLDRHVRLFHS